MADVKGHDVYFDTNFTGVEKRRCSLVSDISGDGQVNLLDLSIFSQQWLNYIEGLEPQADLNNDKNVTLIDFAILADQWRDSVAYKSRQTANHYDPCNLEFGTTYFWRVDEFNEPNMWPGEVWSFTVGIDEPVLTNAPTYQVTPTYEGSGQATHPDIVYFADGWRGYKYWMAMTPYPHFYARVENPSILVSNDGSSWEVPPGLTNPIISAPVPGYNADPDIIYNDDANELWIYFLRCWNDTEIAKLALMRSSDGIHWSEPEYLITWDRHIGMNEGYFAIIKQGSDWHYWALNFYAHHRVTYRHSTDGKDWSAGQSITFSPRPVILPWHLDVIYVSAKQEYWMLFVDDAAKGGMLYLAKSRDRLNWTLGVSEVLSPSIYGWDNDRIYRSTLLYDSNSQLLQVWYPGANTGTEWHIGYTEVKY